MVFHALDSRKKHAWQAAVAAVCLALPVLHSGGEAKSIAANPAPPGAAALVLAPGRRTLTRAPGGTAVWIDDDSIAEVVELGAGTLVVTPRRPGVTHLCAATANGTWWREIDVIAEEPGMPEPVAAPADPPAPEPAMPPLPRLGGIFAAGSTLVALLDGHPTAAGERAGAFRVERVDATGVTLRWNDRTFTVALDSTSPRR